MNPDSSAIQQQADSLAQKAELLQLGPLQEPPPVPFTFDTVGWPILVVIIGISLLLIAFFLIRKHIRNRYRRAALQELQLIENGKLKLGESFVILKRTAIYAFGREKAGALHGTEWYKFLDDTAAGVQFQMYKNEIDALIYKDQEPAGDIRSKLVSNTKKWIRLHAAR